MICHSRSGKSQKRFTLIEMIVVIAIIAVLIALVAPAVSRYIATSKRAVCQSKMEVIKKDYLLERIKDPDASSRDLIDKVMAEYGGTYNKASSYSGLCPTDGLYSVLYPTNNNAAELVLTCTIHGREGTEVDQAHNYIPNLYNSKSALEYINNKLKKNPSQTSFSLDSEANFSGSTTEKVWSEVLGGRGNVPGAWKIQVTTDGKGNITGSRYYWSNDSIKDLTPGKDTVKVTMYDALTDTYSTGTMKVLLQTESGSSYKILHSASFVPDP